MRLFCEENLASFVTLSGSSNPNLLNMVCNDPTNFQFLNYVQFYFQNNSKFSDFF